MKLLYFHLRVKEQNNSDINAHILTHNPSPVRVNQFSGYLLVHLVKVKRWETSITPPPELARACLCC